MQQRMSERDETSRLLMVFKGFFLDRDEKYRTECPLLSDYFREAKRHYGTKNTAESIAFQLGWDRDCVLRESSLPEFVENEAMKIHVLVGKEIKEDEEFAARCLASKQKEGISE